MINFHRATLVNSLQCPTRCHWHLTDFLSQVPVDDNPVVDLLQQFTALAAPCLWLSVRFMGVGCRRSDIEITVGLLRAPCLILCSNIWLPLGIPRPLPADSQDPDPSLKPNRQPITSPDLHPFLHSWFFGKVLSCKWRTRKIFSQSAAEGRDSHGPQGGHRSRHSVDFYRLRR